LEKQMQNEALLRLEHLEKSYIGPDGSEVPVLKGVDLTVARGQSAAITGPSGSGKSTLLNIAGALDRPTGGKVMLGGRDLADLSDRDLARIRSRELGFVFQLHHLLPQCTVLENVLVPTLAGGIAAERDSAAARAEDLLDRVGLTDRRDFRPASLSGGERQRVAVVRALINRPALLLADEPTGSLDRAASDGLIKLLAELNSEMHVAIVVVTHSPAVAECMERRLVLSDGVLQVES